MRRHDSLGATRARLAVLLVLAGSAAGAVPFPLILEPDSARPGTSWNAPEAVGRARVAIVQSTSTSLPHPIPLDQAPTTAQVEDMVRAAVNLLGGMAQYVQGCSLVVIKPNIVEYETSASGVVTDARVVRAVAKLIFEVNPTCRLVIGEAAGGWCPSDTLSHHPSIPVGDGFAHAGYRAILTDPVFTGKRFEIVDLNLDPAQQVTVTPPAYARASYYVPRTLLRASAIIDVPVMKVHVTGITVCLKNNIGVLPGLVYGWWKQVGYPYPSANGLKHTRDVWDEEITDISSVVRPKVRLCVVDAIVGREKYKGPNGIAKRRNTIVAGLDMVAVDAVCTRLMGMNPDDVEHIALAGMKHLGVADIDSVQVLGSTIAQAQADFIKDPSADGTFGQSNRIWSLSGPYAGTNLDYDYLGGETSVWPVPGSGAWTSPFYFFDDYINLATLAPGKNCTVYAHAYFKSPRSGPAELWIGSDEGLKVFLNGALVYEFRGTRTHALPNEIVPLTLTAGRNRLLVKAVQTTGPFDFCLNICDPDTRVEYHGDRVLGLRFYADSTLSGIEEGNLQPVAFYVYAGPNPARGAVPFSVFRSRAEPVRLAVHDELGRVVASRSWQAGSAPIHWQWRPEPGLGAGVYFYRVESGADQSAVRTGKVVLLTGR